MKYFGVLLVSAAFVAVVSAEAKKNETSTTEATTKKSGEETARQSRCLYNQFECSNGRCISTSLICNGRYDCTDGSDESASICRNTPKTTTQSYPGYTEIGERYSCNVGQFNCISGGCLNQNRVCDGYQDCTDGSDESPSICPDYGTGGDSGSQCGPTEFKCTNGKCISAKYQCDGITHCTDASDEDYNSCQGNGGSQTTRPTTTTRPNQGGNNGGNGGNTGGNNGGSSWQTMLTPCLVPAQPANGRWRLHRSLCESGRDCNAPSNIRSMDAGSYLVYNCDEGYILNGTRDVLCGPGGQWINEPRCDEIKCPELSTSATEALCTWNNIAVSCEVSAPVGTHAQLNCRKGFVQEVTYTQTYKNVTCQPDGTWSPNPSMCVKKPKRVKLVLEGDMILED